MQVTSFKGDFFYVCSRTLKKTFNQWSKREVPKKFRSDWPRRVFPTSPKPQRKGVVRPWLVKRGMHQAAHHFHLGASPHIPRVTGDLTNPLINSEEFQHSAKNEFRKGEWQQVPNNIRLLQIYQEWVISLALLKYMISSFIIKCYRKK